VVHLVGIFYCLVANKCERSKKGMINKHIFVFHLKPLV